jgi:uroporphyrin-III C-methyltransferase / precorrin-2 dehydrogenase / sirohydrochlorin ferrochelatase
MKPSSPYLPIFFRAEGACALVVGAGPVAVRKIESLLRRGAIVTVVALEIPPAVRRMAGDRLLRLIEGPFRPSHLAGQTIVFSATNDPGVNRSIARAAGRRGIPVNVADSPDECTFLSPAIVEDEEFTLAVSTGGKNPGAARAIREFLDDHRAELSVRLERGRRRRRLAPVPGKVYIVGAGPGDPDLLTVRALGLIRGADVLLHDYLVPEEILSLAREQAIRICYARRGRTSGHGSALKQQAIHDAMARYARDGKKVVRLKSGDPLIFGRGGEEAQFLVREGIPFEIVPGITAAVGCAASAAISLTHRDISSSVTLVAGHESAGGPDGKVDWNRLPRDGMTAIYMGVDRIAEIGRSLAEAGFPPDMPFAAVENGTRRSQRILRGRLRDLPRIAERERLRSPAILFVGRAAALSECGERAGSPIPHSACGHPGMSPPRLHAGQGGKRRLT